MTSSSTVKYLSKLRWLLLLSFSSVFLMFLYKELNLISNYSNSFERWIRKQASIPASSFKIHHIGSPFAFGPLKSVVDLMTGLPSSISEMRTNGTFCRKRRKSRDEKDSQFVNVMHRKLEIAITRKTDTFSMDLEASILPKKKKKGKTSTKSGFSNVVDEESGGEPDKYGAKSTSKATDLVTDKNRFDDGGGVPSIKPNNTSFGNHSTSRKDSSLAVNKFGMTVSKGSVFAVKHSDDFFENRKMMKAVDPTKIYQNKFMKSKMMDMQSADMIDVSSIEAIDFKEDKIVNVKSENTTTLGNDGNLDSGSLEKQLFYMYDLDEDFWWRWPKPETDCRHVIFFMSYYLM